MSRPTCTTCRFFDAMPPAGPIDLADKNRAEGQCRRWPPDTTSIALGAQLLRDATWPTVRRADWCGEHAAQPQEQQP